MTRRARVANKSCAGLFFALSCAALLAGCDGSQSVLSPMGDMSGAIALLSRIIFIGGALILLFVTILIIYAITASPERRRSIATDRTVIWGGVAFPIVTLSAMLIYGLSLTGQASGSGGEAPLRIEVTGEQFWWRIVYPGENGGDGFETANELRIPVGRPVELTLASADVIHSFWVPRLSGKLDMIPGLENRLTLKATEAGTARGQCAEYCGIQHAQMAFQTVALPENEFSEWRAKESGPAQEPQSEAAQQGQQAFISSGCGACHTIRGTAALGEIGPDLTHFGSREFLGAGTLKNTQGNIAAWIASSQHLKQGNLMPSFEMLSEDDRRSIAAYLEGLK